MKTLDLIKSDLARLDKVSFTKFLKWYFFPKGSTFPFQVWFRIVAGLKKNKFLKFTIGSIAYFIYRHFSFKYGISANTNIEVGAGLNIAHGFGVFLNCKKIGENFTVYQGVTLGSDAHDNSLIPTVGNSVTIYPGSVITGGITLGDFSVIGANSYVSKNIPEYAIAVGAPVKIIKYRNR